MVPELDGDKSKEVKITKLQVDGKEHIGNVIPADATKNKQAIQVNIFTEGVKKVDQPAQTTTSEEA